MEGTGSDWEVGGEGEAGDVGIVGAVDGKCRGLVEDVAAEVGGVDERGACGVELGDKAGGIAGVAGPVRGLECAAGGGEVAFVS